MFRKMRREEKKGITNEECITILKEAKRGVLAVTGDDDYPYAFPVNFYYDESENRIYIHSAKAGHKVDAIKGNPKICFTVYSDPVIKDLDWAPYLSSVVVFGNAELMTEPELFVDKLRTFAMKYYPSEAEAEEEIRADINAVQLIAVNIEHMTGKTIQEK
ncbi:MAG: pyridoxamine 5'-phosphate oxidase family protein [Anaerovoracaceae bacterium]